MTDQTINGLLAWFEYNWLSPFVDFASQQVVELYEGQAGREKKKVPSSARELDSRQSVV